MTNADKSQRCELKIYKKSLFAITILERRDFKLSQNQIGPKYQWLNWVIIFSQRGK
jgi:hypothetical protein